MRRCIVCGVAGHTCGPPSPDVIPVDIPPAPEERMAGPRRRYPHPTRKGAWINADEATAARLGLLAPVVEAVVVVVEEPPAPIEEEPDPPAVDDTIPPPPPAAPPPPSSSRRRPRTDG